MLIALYIYTTYKFLTVIYNMSISPLNLRQKIFNVSSSQRTNTADVAESAEITLNMPRRNRFSMCSIVRAEIPKSYYMLGLNDTDTFQITEATGGPAFTVTLTGDRDYSATELGVELKTALDTASAADGNGQVYTVTFNTNTRKYTISNVTNDFTLDFTGSALIAKYLGFSAGLQLISTGVNNSIVSVNVVNQQRHDVIFIRSSIALNNNDDILGILYPSSYSEGAIIAYQPSDVRTSAVAVANNDANTFRFTLMDSDNNVVDLNGLNWSLVLVLWDEATGNDSSSPL